MPKPALGGLQRLRPEFRRVELTDAQLNTPIVVYLRPLLPTERDAIAPTAQPFIDRFVTGGYRNEAGHWVEEPEPLMVGDVRVPIDSTVARKLHRYEAMQRALPGKTLPPDADPLDVAYMVEMSVTLLDAWPQLEAECERTWLEGVSGKAFGLTS